MKNFLKTIFVICLVCILTTGCKTKQDEITTLKFSSWGSASEIKIITPVIKEFEKANPNVRIEFIHIPQDYFQKLHLLIASNLAPDVMLINNLNFKRYQNYLEDLSDYVNNDEFFPQSLEVFSHENKLYAIPRDASTLVVYYNKTIFKKYGVEYPKKNWSLDDLIYRAGLTTKNGTFGINFEPDLFYALPYIHYFHGGIYDSEGKFITNSGNTQKGINLYKDLAYKYHIAPTLAQKGSRTSAQMFLDGKIVMHLSGRWMVPKYRECAKFDWDIINFPDCSASTDASGWAISKSSKHKDLAIKFVLFLASKNSIRKMTSDGLIVPARKDVAFSNDFLNGKPQHSDIFLYSVEHSKPTIVSKDYVRIVDKITDKNFRL